MKNYVHLFLLAPLCLCGCSDTSSVVPTHTVSVQVPDMECPFEDWPVVKRTLEAEPGTGEVILADQPPSEEPEPESSSFVDILQNRVVYVDVSDDFNAEQAIAALADKGYLDSRVRSFADEP